MKALLINPPYSIEERYGKDLGKFGPLNEPLGLAYIAATLEQHGHEVHICDAPALGLTASGICELIRGKAYDLVGVTMLTPMYARSVQVVKSIRKAFPKIKIVVGGPHPTILPHETLTENKEIDFLVTYREKPAYMIEVKWSDGKLSPNFKVFKKHFPECKSIQLVKVLKREKTYPDGTEIRRACKWLSEFCL